MPVAAVRRGRGRGDCSGRGRLLETFGAMKLRACSSPAVLGAARGRPMETAAAGPAEKYEYFNDDNQSYCGSIPLTSDSEQDNDDSGAACEEFPAPIESDAEQPSAAVPSTARHDPYTSTFEPYQAAEQPILPAPAAITSVSSTYPPTPWPSNSAPACQDAPCVPGMCTCMYCCPATFPTAACGVQSPYGQAPGLGRVRHRPIRQMGPLPPGLHGAVLQPPHATSSMQHVDPAPLQFGVQPVWDSLYQVPTWPQPKDCSPWPVAPVQAAGGRVIGIDYTTGAVVMGKKKRRRGRRGKGRRGRKYEQRRLEQGGAEGNDMAESSDEESEESS
ncbi:hypothetical protein DIPPA_35750 [Diplonema papillatum]|nr:hypothetical protein DIPPA_35750 [Diplonema papillatum]|eukprot:gene12067-18643_t